MQNSRKRVRQKALESLSRRYILESRFRLWARYMVEEEARKRDLPNQLYKAYRLQ